MVDQPTRMAVYALCMANFCEGKLHIIAAAIHALNIGTRLEQDNVIAEWSADYFQYPYSVWPRHTTPRLPRSCGEPEDE